MTIFADLTQRKEKRGEKTKTKSKNQLPKGRHKNDIIVVSSVFCSQSPPAATEMLEEVYLKLINQN